MNFFKNSIIKFSFFTLLFLCLIIAWLGFGERGFIHLYKMEKERESYLDHIKIMEKNNNKLINEIERLRTDKKYIESVARKELGLIKDNETLFRFIRKDENQKQ